VGIRRGPPPTNAVRDSTLRALAPNGVIRLGRFPGASPDRRQADGVPGVNGTVTLKEANNDMKY